MIKDIQPWSEPVDGATLLDEIYLVVKEFIICQDETARAVTLWIAFTWFIEHVQVAPLAIITAPEKRCGKTQLLTLIGLLSRRPLQASNISAAAIFRVVDQFYPTLLIDEADSFLKENEAARGILNSGHTRDSAYVIRTVGNEHEPKMFSTWGAKAISGIGAVADTLNDRAVMMVLRRRFPQEVIKRVRNGDKKYFKTLSAKLARYAKDFGPAIGSMTPSLPNELHDRAQDNWEPLLAVADHAGGEWPGLARAAAIKLSETEIESLSISTELLMDIYEVFTEDRISTRDLLKELNDDDLKPWATYNRGRPMSARQLAKRLSEYGVRSRSIRIGDRTPKGYLRTDLEEVFRCYLSSMAEASKESATPQQISENQENTGFGDNV